MVSLSDDDTRSLKWVAAALAILLGGAFLAWIGFSYCEATAYNRVTGKDVTTFEAMFLDLRVHEAVNR